MNVHPSTMNPLYCPSDMDAARELFGAMCGHGALAAAIGEEVGVTEHLFERSGGWVNLPQMLKAVALCPRHRVARQETQWLPGGQEMKLVLIQFTGPWMDAGRPPSARCKYRHWIAARGYQVWDANEPRWIHCGVWKHEIVPQLVPRLGTGWEVFRALVIETF